MLNADRVKKTTLKNKQLITQPKQFMEHTEERACAGHMFSVCYWHHSPACSMW